MNPYVIGPVLGAFFGALFGWLMNSRSILGSANWIPGYVLMGILWGLMGATRLGYTKKEDREKGELLTETKEYNKKLKKRKQQKTDIEQK